MSSNKALIKERVITRGAGAKRAVLCYESGLVYQYSDPSNIVGMYSPGKGWVILEKPYYRRGGWGNSSTGVSDGHHLIENAEDLVDAIGATRFKLNAKQFLTASELKQLNREIELNNRLIKKQNELAKKLGRTKNETELTPQETIKLTLRESGRNGIKGLNPIETIERYQSAIQVFLTGKGKPTKVDTYSVTNNSIVFNETSGDRLVVAFKDSQNQVFLNSQLIKTTDFEYRFLGGQSIIQAEVRKVAKYSIPFNVLASADLKLEETRILEQGPESEHHVKVGPWNSKTEIRHFTGALLLENAGRKFLMDIDREEIKHGIFNAFFVEVDSKVKSIAEAYESMKPQAVRDAEASGIEVQRQGEWFFIATDKTLKVLSDRVYENTIQLGRKKENFKVSQYILKSEVSHGKGRPNTLYKPVGFSELDQYVCGVVRHSGREHRDLDLGSQEVTSSGNGDYTTFKLWQLVPNTTVGNFTIQGDVD